MIEKIKALRPFLLPISILAFAMIFGSGASLFNGFNQTWLQVIMQYVSLFGGYVIQIIVLIIGILFVWKKNLFRFSKEEMKHVHISMAVSGVYIFFFTFLWLGILRTGIH